MTAEENSNYALFRDCLSTTLLRLSTSEPGPVSKRRRRAKKGSGPAPNSSGHKHKHKASSVSQVPTVGGGEDQQADELADFIDYLAWELFDGLPEELQHLDYRSWRDDAELQAQYAFPLTEDSLAQLSLSPSVTETLHTYHLTSPETVHPNEHSSVPTTTEAFLLPILTSYIAPLIEPPPATNSTRGSASACEICGRWWIPLSYHHLIPRFVHDKAVKRGWHKKEDLQNVAWLCGACHRFVHSFKNHEELAREYYTVDRLMEAEEVRRFAAWVSKLRWKGR